MVGCDNQRDNARSSYSSIKSVRTMSFAGLSFLGPMIVTRYEVSSLAMIEGEDVRSLVSP